MKGTVVVTIFVFFLLSTSISIANLEIKPETVEVYLIGGDSIQINITVCWLDDCPVICKLTTYFEPDGEGINVTYSKNNFIMIPYLENNIVMYINTSLLLMPNIYNITTRFDMDEQEPEDEEDSYQHTTWENPVEPTEPQEPVDEEYDDENGNDKFNNTVYYASSSEGIQVDPFLIFASVSLIITFLYVIIKRKKKAEKPGEKKK